LKIILNIMGKKVIVSILLLTLVLFVKSAEVEKLHIDVLRHPGLLDQA